MWIRLGSFWNCWILPGLVISARQYSEGEKKLFPKKLCNISRLWFEETDEIIQIFSPHLVPAFDALKIWGDKHILLVPERSGNKDPALDVTEDSGLVTLGWAWQPLYVRKKEASESDFFWFIYLTQFDVFADLLILLCVCLSVWFSVFMTLRICMCSLCLFSTCQHLFKTGLWISFM